MSDIKKDIRKARESLRKVYDKFILELREVHLDYGNKLFDITERIDKYLETLENNER